MNKFKLKFKNKENTEVEEEFVFSSKINSGFTYTKLIAKVGKKHPNFDLKNSTSIDSLSIMNEIGIDLMGYCTSHDLKTEEKIEDYFENAYEEYVDLFLRVVNVVFAEKKTDK